MIGKTSVHQGKVLFGSFRQRFGQIARAFSRKGQKDDARSFTVKAVRRINLAPTTFFQQCGQRMIEIPSRWMDRQIPCFINGDVRLFQETLDNPVHRLVIRQSQAHQFGQLIARYFTDRGFMR